MSDLGTLHTRLDAARRDIAASGPDSLRTMLGLMDRAAGAASGADGGQKELRTRRILELYDASRRKTRASGNRSLSCAELEERVSLVREDVERNGPDTLCQLLKQTDSLIARKPQWSKCQRAARYRSILEKYDASRGLPTRTAKRAGASEARADLASAWEAARAWLCEQGTDATVAILKDYERATRLPLSDAQRDEIRKDFTDRASEAGWSGVPDPAPGTLNSELSTLNSLDAPCRSIRERAPKATRAYLVGKGPSLDLMTEGDFAEHPDAPILCCNESIHKIEGLDLPNPLFCVQQDRALKVRCRPQRATWLLSYQAWNSGKGGSYPRAVRYGAREFDGSSRTLTALIAVRMIAKCGGFREIIFAGGWDACTCQTVGYADCIGESATARHKNGDRFLRYCGQYRRECSKHGLAQLWRTPEAGRMDRWNDGMMERPVSLSSAVASVPQTMPAQAGGTPNPEAMPLQSEPVPDPEAMPLQSEPVPNPEAMPAQVGGTPNPEAMPLRHGSYPSSSHSSELGPPNSEPSTQWIFACVLRSGGEYGPEHVHWMKHQVDAHVRGTYRFVCLTDLESIEGIQTLPLAHPWRGWWSKIELFRPGLFDGPVAFLDLDMVIHRDLQLPDPARLPERGVCAHRDHTYKHVINSALMLFRPKATEFLYHEFLRKPKQWMREFKGDQDFINARILAMGGSLALPPWSWANYRKMNKCNPGADIVAFYGRIRPWKVKHSWIPPLEGARASSVAGS